MRGIRRFGVLALVAVMLSPFVPASISHASGGETVTISGLDPVAASGSDTFSVSLSGFDNSANYIVVLTVSDGTLTVQQSGSATKLFGYTDFSGDPLSVTDDNIGFEGSHSDIDAMLGSVVFTASGTLGEPDLSVSVAEKPGADDIYYWPGDGSANSARYYQHVTTSETWVDAEKDARSTSSPDNSLGGIAGYLARPSSHEENQFIGTKLEVADIWIGARRGTDACTAQGSTEELDGWIWASDDRAFADNGPSDRENGELFFRERWHDDGLHDDDWADYSGWASDFFFIDTDGDTEAGLDEWLDSSGQFVNPWTEGEPNGNTGSIECFAATNYDNNGTEGLQDDERALWNDFRVEHKLGYLVEYNAHQMTTLASDVATASATVASEPDAPGAPSVTVAPGQATVSWSAPDSNFSTITGYTATASPTGVGSSETCTTVTTSCVITGLTASTSYNFTVTATNAMGTSSASTVTAETIPDDPEVKFDSNSGTGTMSDQVGNTATALSANTFERDDFSFVGWNTEPDGSGTDYADGATYAFDSNLTLYAQWQATNSGGNSGGSSDDEDPDVSGLPKIPTTTPGTFGLPPRPPGTLPQRFPGGNGPVVLGGPTETPRNPNGPSTTPRGFVGGLPTPTETSEDDDGGVTVTTGSLRLGLRPIPIPGEPGLPGNGGMGMPVPHGGSTEFQGGGLLPGSQLQVFLTGGSQRELGRIPVSQTGEFDGEIQFNTPRGEAQLPIGPHVIQAIGYDAEGKQTIVEVPINIAQGPATPETDRVSGELPNLGLGTSTATSAGVPIDVNVTGVPETRTVTVDGGDFGFVIQSNGQAQVQNTPTSARVFLDSSSTVSITGNGLMSDTTASVWVFSTPTQLATVQVDPSGGMSTDVLIDPQFIEPGNHTLQIQAVGTDGFIRSFNIGVVIEDPTDVPTASLASTVLWWVAGLFALLLAVVGGGLRWKRRNAHPIGI